MTPTAIHQAIRLNKYPNEMAWLCQSNNVLPSEVTELLRLSSSNENIKNFAKKNHTDAISLQKLLLNFIDNVLLNESNSNEKLLGLTENSNPELLKLHYQLLIKIYHPDRNLSPDAAYQTARITKAYQNLKKQKTMAEYKNIRISRVHPKSFYTATNQAEKQISNLKSAFIAILAITVISAVWIGGYLYEPSKQELFTKKDLSTNNQDEVFYQKQDKNPDNLFSMARQVDIANENDSQDQLHVLLASIEVAYEKGDATKIQRILNSPEIKQQPDKEVFSKLKNLFRITSDRKMLLYDFEWKSLSGQIYGKGKFLSRYHLNKRNQWLTREGVASVLISDTDKKLDIISLKLDNKNIDQ
jgi:curved DNA-binding protein CbpA